MITREQAEALVWDLLDASRSYDNAGSSRRSYQKDYEAARTALIEALVTGEAK